MKFRTGIIQNYKKMGFFEFFRGGDDGFWVKNGGSLVNP
jgi:hypothetical protein